VKLPRQGWKLRIVLLLSESSLVLFVSFPVARAVRVLLTTFPSCVSTKWVSAIVALDKDAMAIRGVTIFIFEDGSEWECQRNLLHSDEFGTEYE
jgi:hypothetical protein